jgi:hypothetical protein
VAEASSGHAPSGIEVRRIVALLAIVAASVVVLAWAIRSAMVRWVTPEHAALVTRAAPIPPAPRLQPIPGTDLEALRAQKRALLSKWEWTDPSHQFARIPIERAMSLYAQGARVQAQEGAQPPQEGAQPPQEGAQPHESRRPAEGDKP